MTPEFFHDRALVPAMRMLPSKLDTIEARAMVVAICLQESRLEHRAQIGGPARSYAQFELAGGVMGVLNHRASRPHIQAVLAALDYDPASDAPACFRAIEHNDILAAAFARLLLWTLPDSLPDRNASAIGWSVYTKAWRPGKPRRETWDTCFARAWVAIDG